MSVDEYGQRPKLDWRDYLEAREGVVSGSMCVKGTRLPVWAILNELSTGTREDILNERTNITSEDIDAALSYARDVIGEMTGSFLAPVASDLVT